MSEKEKKTLESLTDNLKKMAPEDKGFLLGYATAKAEAAANAKKEAKT